MTLPATAVSHEGTRGASGWHLEPSIVAEKVNGNIDDTAVCVCGVCRKQGAVSAQGLRPPPSPDTIRECPARVLQLVYYFVLYNFAYCSIHSCYRLQRRRGRCHVPLAILSIKQTKKMLESQLSGCCPVQSSRIFYTDPLSSVETPRRFASRYEHVTSLCRDILSLMCAASRIPYLRRLHHRFYGTAQMCCLYTTTDFLKYL